MKQKGKHPRIPISLDSRFAAEVVRNRRKYYNDQTPHLRMGQISHHQAMDRRFLSLIPFTRPINIGGFPFVDPEPCFSGFQRASVSSGVLHCPLAGASPMDLRSQSQLYRTTTPSLSCCLTSRATKPNPKIRRNNTWPWLPVLPCPCLVFPWALTQIRNNTR